MKATGSSTERTIWNFLRCKGLSLPVRQGSWATFTLRAGSTLRTSRTATRSAWASQIRPTRPAVDSGAYSNFVHDSTGYGLAQWTYWSRKESLLNFARKIGASIGSLEMQLDFMIRELKGYAAVWEVLRTARTVREASDIVLTRYERPANMSSSVKAKRASFGQAYFDAYANRSTEKEDNIMGNSRW